MRCYMTGDSPSDARRSQGWGIIIYYEYYRKQKLYKHISSILFKYYNSSSFEITSNISLHLSFNAGTSFVNVAHVDALSIL
jgi:hypothetical protein